MFNNIDTLIFDMDGTLIDSMGVWKDIDIEFLGERNIPFPEDLQDSIQGMCFKDCAVYFKKRFKLTESLEEIQNIWHKMAEYKYGHSVKLKDGVLEFLQSAKNKGFKTGIATSNSRALTDILLNSQNIYKYFDYVLTGCESLKSKPDPEVYLYACKELNSTPCKCLVFEDTIPGILAGKNAGMKVVAIDDLYSKHQTDEKVKLSDYFIHSYFELKLPD